MRPSAAARPAGPCPACGHPRATPAFQMPFPEHSARPGRAFRPGERLDVSSWQLVRCASCAARYPDPYPSRTEIETYYGSQLTPSDYEREVYVELDEHARAAWAGWAERFTRLHGRPGRLLEVGPAGGWLLAAAATQGWAAYGVEASPRFAVPASAHPGVTVECGTVAGLAGRPDSPVRAAAPFDVITMFDVIEHLHDPVADLRTLRGLVAPDGRLVVATLDIGSPIARLYGRRWRQLVISHIVYWTRPALDAALRRSGWVLESVADVRSWDPDPARRRRRRIIEAGKFAARAGLSLTYVPASRRLAALRGMPARLTRGRVDHDSLLVKIGDQPVLGDVVLVVARPAAGPLPVDPKVREARQRRGAGPQPGR